MLIGEDDSSTDVITQGTRFSMFVSVVVNFLSQVIFIFPLFQLC